ncbi:MAG TPA: glycosyltransferase, partial [Candidatus Krumholzibacteria bacterium]|nr:glycosyltransferase [Candidatus Krumholzibacteria bacterium]
MLSRVPAGRPDASVVIPTCTRLELLQACVAALEAEPVAPSFEIVVVDNGSTDGTVPWLREAEAAGRLRALLNPRNLGFAAACNQGAEAARGRCVVFLNNDTEATAGWLDPLVDTLDLDPRVGAVGARLLYPDGTIQHGGVVLVENRRPEGTTLEGLHVGAGKPADDPACSRPQRLPAVTAAVMAVRRDEFLAVGGFDTAYWNGNEDVDFCLRLGARGQLVVYRPECVVVHHESQSGPQRWSRVGDNVRLLGERWLGKVRPDLVRASDGTVAPGDSGRLGTYATPTVRLPAPARGAGSVTVVVLTWNALEFTKLCAESLLRHTDPRHELMFVDNGSREDTLAYLDGLAAAHPDRVTVIRNGRNLGFAAGNNVGIAHAQGEHVCLLNSDTVVTPGWLDRLLARLDDPRVGLVGPVTNSITGAQRLPAVAYDQDGLDGLEAFAARHARADAGRTDPALWLVGFCLLVRREALACLGGLDERFGQGNFEDTDYGLRAFLAGWRAVVARDAFIHHFGSRSFVDGKVDYSAAMNQRWEIFRSKWHLDADARETGRFDFEAMLAGGFTPVLHTEPLPPGGGVACPPPARWLVEAAVGRGEQLFAAGRVVESIATLRAVLAIDPSHARAAGDLAVVLWQADPAAGAAEAVTLLEGVLDR